MSTGLVPIDVAISSPASGTFESGAQNDLGLNYNPAFLAGSGTLTSSPSGGPSASQSAAQYPSTSAPSSAVAVPGGYPAGPGYATLGTTYPGAAINGAPGLTLPALGISSTWLWLGAGILVLAMLMPSGRRH